MPVCANTECKKLKEFLVFRKIEGVEYSINVCREHEEWAKNILDLIKEKDELTTG